MPYSADGFDFFYTHRGSWKAERRHAGRLIDIVPVTWTKGRREADGVIWQAVWYENPKEMETQRTNPHPFVVVVAIAKDYSVMPHSPKDFQAVFEVQATGVALSEQSIETKVLRRLKAGEEG